LLKLAFHDGFVQSRQLDRVLQIKVERVATILEHFNLKQGLKAIMYRAQINTEARCRENEQAARTTLKVFDRLLTRRYRQGIASLKHFATADRVNYLKLKTVVMNCLVR